MVLATMFRLDADNMFYELGCILTIFVYNIGWMLTICFDIIGWMFTILFTHSVGLKWCVQNRSDLGPVSNQLWRCVWAILLQLRYGSGPVWGQFSYRVGPDFVLASENLFGAPTNICLEHPEYLFGARPNICLEQPLQTPSKHTPKVDFAVGL